MSTNETTGRADGVPPTLTELFEDHRHCDQCGTTLFGVPDGDCADNLWYAEEAAGWAALNQHGNIGPSIGAGLIVDHGNGQFRAHGRAIPLVVAHDLALKGFGEEAMYGDGVPTNLWMQRVGVDLLTMLAATAEEVEGIEVVGAFTSTTLHTRLDGPKSDGWLFTLSAPNRPLHWQSIQGTTRWHCPCEVELDPSLAETFSTVFVQAPR